ncbi:hypothetical protein CVT26_000578 [Gymnopilus dilepis]|uniref:Uncharacterized protein n=1 Tax=Gymnopilus dilepis TaxID=231916 RepID=A0A409VHF4_9AGAR|nr:hypothetical protein CVT26_000578 [Gymnopilus dilepis]
MKFSEASNLRPPGYLPVKLLCDLGDAIWSGAGRSFIDLHVPKYLRASVAAGQIPLVRLPVRRVMKPGQLTVVQQSLALEIPSEALYRTCSAPRTSFGLINPDATILQLRALTSNLALLTSNAACTTPYKDPGFLSGFRGALERQFHPFGDD